MNARNRKLVDAVYPFLAERWDAVGSACNEYLAYDEIILEFVREVRRTTPVGSQRFIQMTCLFEYEPLARSIAWFKETPDWPIEYQLYKVDYEYGKEDCYDSADD